jgi:hypothetical protein
MPQPKKYLNSAARQRAYRERVKNGTVAGQQFPATTYIYALVDPRTGHERYIGQTRDPDRRYRQHLDTSAANAAVAAWIGDLASSNLKPSLRILDVIRDMRFYEFRYQLEQDYIHMAQLAGHYPLNHTGAETMPQGGVPCE